MSASYISLQEVAEMALHLSSEEQKQLIHCIQQQLPTASELFPMDNTDRSSSAAILGVIAKPPHVSSEDVDELEQAITAGKIPIQQKNIFDQENRV